MLATDPWAVPFAKKISFVLKKHVIVPAENTALLKFHFNSWMNPCISPVLFFFLILGWNRERFSYTL